MALNDAQYAELRRELGSDIDEIDLDDRYARLGNVTAVAAEVLGERLGGLLQAGSSFTLPGVYSESNDAVIRALQTRLTALQAQLAADAAAAAEALAPEPVPARIVRADRVR